MLKIVIGKQCKNSIFSSLHILNKSNICRKYSDSSIDKLLKVLADPKLNCDQVTEQIDILLSKNKDLINMCEKYSYYTPLMCAVCNSVNYLDTVERIKLLLDRGANPNAISYASSFGYTPLLLAIKDSPISYSIIKILLKYGCSVDERAVWQSVMFGSFDTVKLLEQHHVKSISDMRDTYDRTVLDYAELYTRDEYFKYKLYRHYEQQKLKSLIKKE